MSLKESPRKIWQQTEGKVNYFFAGLGTCGTITGVGKYLKEQNPEIKIIAVEPSSSEHKLPGLKRITGLAEEYQPRILDKSVIDEMIEVSDRDAYQASVDLARKEGILVGPTTGAIIYTALRYGKSQKGLAVAISPDDAFKYAGFYKDYLEAQSRSPKVTELDLCDTVCPLSKIKAMELFDSLNTGESARIVLGDKDSLKSVAQESKSRGLKLEFKQENEARFIVSVTK